MLLGHYIHVANWGVLLNTLMSQGKYKLVCTDIVIHLNVLFDTVIIPRMHEPKKTCVGTDGFL